MQRHWCVVVLAMMAEASSGPDKMNGRFVLIHDLYRSMLAGPSKFPPALSHPVEHPYAPTIMQAGLVDVQTNSHETRSA